MTCGSSSSSNVCCIAGLVLPVMSVNVPYSHLTIVSQLAAGSLSALLNTCRGYTCLSPQ